MYFVQVKKYTVARARQRFAEVLDSAESGEDVVIERRGTSFTVRPIVAARHRKRASRIEIVDPPVEAGGRLADLLVVDGDPSRNIDDLSKIVEVWHRGRRVAGRIEEFRP
jgi:prevent-host-death family protein